MNILVTGGAGYIGSHACVELLQGGYDVTVVDDLSNSSSISLDRVRQITGRKPSFFRVNAAVEADLESVFRKNPVDAVIHFAGWKAVGESVEKPLAYYRNNLDSTLTLLSVMNKYGIKDLVFSSSATVYGNPQTVPIREDFPLTATNPYGWTKLMIEQILRDVSAADPSLKIILLRYFNPVGAHETGLIGEDPAGIPNNLMPYISQVAVGKLRELSVFGNDYPTHDGTGVRDYIHVVDLAKGHVKALQYLAENSGCHVFNLGTGTGYSVLDMVKAFETASGQPIPYRIAPRRSGDIAVCYADPALALKELGWKAEKTLKDMCADSWNWQKKNPKGYK